MWDNSQAVLMCLFYSSLIEEEAAVNCEDVFDFLNCSQNVSLTRYWIGIQHDDFVECSDVNYYSVFLGPIQ